MNEEVMVKFWANVEKTNTCWNWKGATDKGGLPIIRTGGRKDFQEYSGRRISLELDGKVVLPSERIQPLVCKNKLCVNPSHLVFGDEGRFWAKVQRLGKNDCWVWTASQDKDMYGKFRTFENGKKIDIRAHQYSWQLHTGRPVPPGIKVCHTCDHPYCVNPDHLFLGTTLDNNQDAVQKGRHPHGETHGKSKLTEKQVKKIRELNKTGISNIQLSKQFDISESTISDIYLGKRWKYVK